MRTLNKFIVVRALCPQLMNPATNLSNYISLVGNSVRLKVLFLLYKEKKLCVCDLSDILEMNISAISQHLRKMKDRNLIQTKREGQTIFYSLKKEQDKVLVPLFKILQENEMMEEV